MRSAEQASLGCLAPLEQMSRDEAGYTTAGVNRSSRRFGFCFDASRRLFGRQRSFFFSLIPVVDLVSTDDIVLIYLPDHGAVLEQHPVANPGIQTVDHPDLARRSLRNTWKVAHGKHLFAPPVWRFESWCGFRHERSLSVGDEI